MTVSGEVDATYLNNPRLITRLFVIVFEALNLFIELHLFDFHIFYCVFFFPFETYRIATIRYKKQILRRIKTKSYVSLYATWLALIVLFLLYMRIEIL